MRLLSALFILLAAQQGWAFPELIRHGYANCIACHVSPSGGGVLTDYGRSLSKELLSHWGYEGEERALYVINQPEWLKLGGDYRSIQTYLNTNTQKDGKFFVMQADLEGAVQVGKFDVVATAGVQEGPKRTPNEGQFLSRRHYVTFHAKDELTIRAGRFFPKFGLNHPDHTLVTARNLGFDQGSETYNFEVAYLGEKNDLFVTLIEGRPHEDAIDSERAVTISASHFFLDRLKVGFSALRGERKDSRRELLGIHGILGLTKKIYWLSEIVHQRKRGTTSSLPETFGLVSFQQIDYEYLQGFHAYFVHQLSYLDFDSPLSRLDSYGIGGRLYPRPHLEFAAEFRRERSLAVASSYYDVGWILFHFYL